MNEERKPAPETVAVGSALNDRLGGPKTDFDYVMEGLGELAELTNPNDAAEYALAALDMKKQLDRYREALKTISILRDAEESRIAYFALAQDA